MRINNELFSLIRIINEKLKNNSAIKMNVKNLISIYTVHINVGLKYVQPVSLLLFQICFYIIKQLLEVNRGLF